MPRGNDSKAAVQELADKFGKGVGNAEQLIEANLSLVSENLRHAELLPRDEKKTAELQDKLGSLKGPDGERVLDAAVRRAQGDEFTVIVYEGEDGRRRLGVLDQKGKAEQAEFSNVSATVTPGDAPMGDPSAPSGDLAPGGGLKH